MTFFLCVKIWILWLWKFPIKPKAVSNFDFFLGNSNLQLLEKNHCYAMTSDRTALEMLEGERAVARPVRSDGEPVNGRCGVSTTRSWTGLEASWSSTRSTLETNISPPKVCLDIIFLLPRWDMLVFWRVTMYGPWSPQVGPRFFFGHIGLPCQRMISGIFVGIDHPKNWVDMSAMKPKHIRGFFEQTPDINLNMFSKQTMPCYIVQTWFFLTPPTWNILFDSLPWRWMLIMKPCCLGRFLKQHGFEGVNCVEAQRGAVTLSQNRLVEFS